MLNICLHYSIFVNFFHAIYFINIRDILKELILAGPLGFLNFNNASLSGVSPGAFISFPGSLGFGSIQSVPMFPVDMSMGNIDTFCTTMMINQEKMQQEFFAALISILSNMKINHTPEPWVLDNLRPYDYNKYGSNGEKISKLDPTMQQKTMQLLDWAESQGMKVTITSGYRTQAEQNELLRTRPKYAAKNSLHCQGRAIDISIAGGKDSDYKKLADYAKSIGMRWGGDFSKVKERWHFDIGRA